MRLAEHRVGLRREASWRKLRFANACITLRCSMAAAHLVACVAAWALASAIVGGSLER
jgi:hypothetical protein